MISQNAEFGALNDTEIILKAENASRVLLPWAEKIKEIQAEIGDLHYKLNHKWIAYNGHLYLLNPKASTFHETIKLCNDSKAYIADIQDEAEEKYLEEAIRQKHGSYWLGLLHDGREWIWYNTALKPLKTYWMDKEPANVRANKCMRLRNECKENLVCWYAVPCNIQGRGICKQKPEDKWII
ncbi:CD209 antigen-like protein E [Ahaetulla prasina]|uniref:CD209 antigen-like protein E n=1 Tax=Ahaetulla prasina TaxID=499056 RepID=UPI002649BA6A|nr:CD209 antigen-like protein E [Ahaetulla prasina]